MRSSSEQGLPGIQSWPPEVTSAGGGEGPCTVRFNASWVMVTWDLLLHGQTCPTENITFRYLVDGR